MAFETPLDKRMIHQQSPATKNKWYADIPLSSLSSDFKDVTLKLQGFTIPRIVMGTKSLPFRGVEMKVPNRTFNASNKNIRFNYLVDEKWESYLALYQWANINTLTDDPTPFDKVQPTTSPTGDSFRTLPIHVYLLDNMKQTVINIVYWGCLLEEFGEFNISYTDDPEVMSHTFLTSYQRVEIGHQNPLERTHS